MMVAMIGMAVGIVAGLIAFFGAAWAYKQDHVVPIAIYGWAMVLMGVSVAVILAMWVGVK